MQQSHKLYILLPTACVIPISYSIHVAKKFKLKIYCLYTTELYDICCVYIEYRDVKFFFVITYPRDYIIRRVPCSISYTHPFTKFSTSADNFMGTLYPTVCVYYEYVYLKNGPFHTLIYSVVIYEYKVCCSCN